jgi:hypothetical protein
MKIGDLVRHKNPKWNTLGIVININNSVGVLWCNSSFVYQEAIDSLEVVNENR